MNGSRSLSIAEPRRLRIPKNMNKKDNGKQSVKASYRTVRMITMVGGVLTFVIVQLMLLNSRLPVQPQLRRDDGLLASMKTDPIAVLADAQQEKRRQAIRDAMKFAWSNYEEHAFGADVVGPVLGDASIETWGNVSCSLVDALDTLWIMDMKDEFTRARDYVATNLSFDHMGRDGKFISVFETTIREVGGLLSAYELSKDVVFKKKAQELVDLLTPAFDESLGIFYAEYNPFTKHGRFLDWSKDKALLADMGTLQLELRYLSDITGNAEYAQMGDKFYEILQREGSYASTGLFPAYYDPYETTFPHSNMLTVGGIGDSFYEYLLKVFVYSGQRDEDRFLRKLYDEAVDGIEKLLTVYSEQDNLYFLRKVLPGDSKAVHEMEHLACFVPGMLALGTTFETEDQPKNKRQLALAEKIMETCYQMYHKQSCGLSPESVAFPNMTSLDVHHRLRPEVVESLFYMHRVTKDAKYRAYGWEIFQATEAHARTEHGYGTIRNVTQEPVVVENQMESFFLAETLKYHYLLQADDDLIPLDEFVFNTEAHPLRIRRPQELDPLSEFVFA